MILKPCLNTGTAEAAVILILFLAFNSDLVQVRVKWSCYRPGVAQRVGRGIALLFHGRGTRRGWVVSSTPRLHFTPGKDPVPIVQEATRTSVWFLISRWCSSASISFVDAVYFTSFPRYLLVGFPCSRCCVCLLTANINVCEWTSFSLLSRVFAYLPSLNSLCWNRWR